MKKKLTKKEIANLRKLNYSKKQRDDKQLFLVEGRRAIEELLKEKGLLSLICEIFVTPKFASSNNQKHFIEKLKKFKLTEIDEEAMKKISATETPSGVLGLLKKIKWQKDKILSKSKIVLALDRVGDPGNLGTIIRSAHAFGCDVVLLIEDCVDLYNPKVVRSSVGSIFALPVIKVKRKDILNLRKNGYKIISFSPRAKTAFNQLNYNGKMVFLFGSEAEGIGGDLEEKSDFKVKIDMSGNAESLNVAVACSIALYEYQKRDLRPES